MLRPAEQLKLNQLVQTFPLRTSEGFVENSGAPLIATVPEQHTGVLRAGMYSFGLPVSTPEFTVSMLWHPRLDADLAYRWFRGCVREVCTQRLARLGRSGKKKARRVSEPLSLVEARGVEPLSEDRRHIASTCVADSLSFAATHAYRPA